MTKDNIKRFLDLFRAITLLRKELAIFWYDFDTLTIWKWTNIDTITIFPDRLWWLTLLMNPEIDDKTTTE